MLTYLTPGVYKEEEFLQLAAELRTGVPAFLGFAEQGPVASPQAITRWPEFEKRFGKPLPDGYLAYAVRGFFENEGLVCYVVRLADSDDGEAALVEGLKTLEPLDTVDLICTPDITRRRPGSEASALEIGAMQLAVLDHCAKLGDRFAILDARPGAYVDDVLQQRNGLNGANGALYYPWVQVADGPAATGGFIPPCGHLAGVYARSDRLFGVHKAPANEILAGVLDLEVNLTDAAQGPLNLGGVNCLRAFHGRGIRVWGARTLDADPTSFWTYVSIRRLFLTAGRWIERNMADVVFEPNVPSLWARVVRELTTYFDDLFQRGALKGSTPHEAFYIKCDAETNPPTVRDLGQLVVEIGLAPALPSEFVVVRIVYGPTGVTIQQ